MTWTFDPSKGMEPLSGIPLEADDKAFDAACERYEAQFEDRHYTDADGNARTIMAKGSVKLGGLYIHTPDPKASAAPEKET